MFKRVSLFWIGLLVVVVLAGVPRLMSYGFSLPYVDHPDEPAYYLGALEWRGQYDSGGYYVGIPPAYVAFHAALMPFLQAAGINSLGDTTRVMRFIAVAVNLATLVVIALTARLAAGDFAGLVAGAAWGISPPVLVSGVLALPDPFVNLFVALAVWLALIALVRPEHSYYAVWSVLAGLMAVLTKYVLPALLPGCLVALVIFIRRERRQGLILLVTQGILIALTGFWLILGYGVDLNNLPREGNIVQTNGLQNALDLGRVTNNVYQSILPLNPVNFLIVCVLGLTAFLTARRRGLPRVRFEGIGLALCVLITVPWLVATYSDVIPGKVRYVLPATTAACVILGIALAQFILVMPARWRQAGYVLSTALLVLLVFYPQWQEDSQLVQQRSLPDRRVELRQWFDVNLEPGTVLLGEETGKVFNPFWGGIPYRHWYNWWFGSIPDKSVKEWREDYGISYALIPYWHWQELQEKPEARVQLEQMLHLRDFVTPPQQRGPDMVVYRLWRMQQETDIRFGDSIRLLGYDESAAQLQPGDTVTYHLYWTSVSTPPDNYSMYLHLSALDNHNVLSQVDGSPAVSERPTLSWGDPSETLISPAFELVIPGDLPRGQYRVLLGLYNFQTGERLTVYDAEGRALGDAFQLAEISVRP